MTCFIPAKIDFFKKINNPQNFHQATETKDLRDTKNLETYVGNSYILISQKSNVVHSSGGKEDCNTDRNRCRRYNYDHDLKAISGSYLPKKPLLNSFIYASLKQSIKGKEQQFKLHDF